MSKVIVIGHKVPDTDSVVSAIIFSKIKKEEGVSFVPAVAGDLNRETELVLSLFNTEVPLKVEEKSDDEKFFLVDHNDLSQSVAEKEDVVGVLDHHQLSGMKTDRVLYFRVEPLGSTCSLLYEIIKDKKIEVSKEDAGLLAAGVVSDTLNLNSSTTTEKDVLYLKELSEKAEINCDDLAEKMFTAKSDFSGRSTEEIICGDMKEYDFNGKKVGIGVSEVTSLDYFLKNDDTVSETVKSVKKEKNLDAFFFGAVDIIKQNTNFYFAGEEEKEIINDLFSGKEQGNYFVLEGVSSRKKEIAPVISEHYQK
jgi:manganese-dependent inorganic pyrophosphatase